MNSFSSDDDSSSSNNDKGIEEDGRNKQIKELDFSLMLASSVHDMKNSLGMLLTSLEEVVALAPPEDDQQKQHFSTLQYEASRINSDLIQLLTIYRLKEKNLPFHLDEYYIYETFEDQVARNDMLFVSRGIDFQMFCDEDLVWFYDNELIGNVIHNVLINSIRYAKSKVILEAEIEDKFLKIQIEDDGKGFPEFMVGDAKDHEGVTVASNSTQLGLFFANRIAKFHQQNGLNGRIELSNGGRLGGGVFAIYIP